MRILFVFVFLSSVAFGQTEKKQFIELNGGIASIGSYDYSMPMPGASVLYGQTFQKNLKSFLRLLMPEKKLLWKKLHLKV